MDCIVLYIFIRAAENSNQLRLLLLWPLQRRLWEQIGLPAFTKIRSKLENFLMQHKEFVTLIIKRTGAGRRSLGRITRYMETVFKGFKSGKTDQEVLKSLRDDAEFLFLVASMAVPSVRQEGDNPGRRFSRSTKSATFIETAVKGAVRCGICDALVHVNSMQFDHIDDKKGVVDQRLWRTHRYVHPYCNSDKAIAAFPLLGKE